MKKLLLLITAIFIAIVPISSANAETAWRYWSYWQLNDGKWEMAMTGPADVKAEDGQVQGWRYITAGMEISDDFAPRTDETFESICADIAQKPDTARIAVVVDFGDASDYSNEDDAASAGETKTACVEVASGDPSSLLLSSAFESREEGGMVCSVENLPSAGCGEEVEIPAAVDQELLTTTSVDEESTPGSDSTKYLTFGAALLGIIAIAMMLKKKNKA